MPDDLGATPARRGPRPGRLVERTGRPLRRPRARLRQGHRGRAWLDPVRAAGDRRDARPRRRATVSSCRPGHATTPSSAGRRDLPRGAPPGRGIVRAGVTAPIGRGHGRMKPMTPHETYTDEEWSRGSDRRRRRRPRMAAGSEAALETLYDRYASAIFAAAYRLTVGSRDRRGGRAGDIPRLVEPGRDVRLRGRLARRVAAHDRPQPGDRPAPCGRAAAVARGPVVGGGAGRGPDPGARAARLGRVRRRRRDHAARPRGGGRRGRRARRDPGRPRGHAGGRTDGHPAGLPGGPVTDGDRRPAGMAARDRQDTDAAGAPAPARGARSRVRPGRRARCRCRSRPARIDKDTMDHDATREQTGTGGCRAGRARPADGRRHRRPPRRSPRTWPAVRRAPRSSYGCSGRPSLIGETSAGDAAGRPAGTDARRDPCRGRVAAAASRGRSPPWRRSPTRWPRPPRVRPTGPVAEPSTGAVDPIRRGRRAPFLGWVATIAAAVVLSVVDHLVHRRLAGRRRSWPRRPRRSTALEKVTSATLDRDRLAGRRARRARRRDRPDARRRHRLLAVDGRAGRRRQRPDDAAGRPGVPLLGGDRRRRASASARCSSAATSPTGSAPTPAIAGVSSGATFGVSLVDAAGPPSTPTRSSSGSSDPPIAIGRRDLGRRRRRRPRRHRRAVGASGGGASR